MQNVNEIVAKNLLKYREQNHLSLDNMSQLTNISKTMLSQVEKGTTNPTINTLMKIANGLHISLTSLITPENDKINQIDVSDLNPVYNEDKNVVIYPYFPYNHEHSFEMFSMEFKTNGLLVSEGHNEGSKEFIIVNSGELTLKINDEVYSVKEAQAISFNSDLYHEYYNSNKQLLTLTATIQY